MNTRCGRLSPNQASMRSRYRNTIGIITRGNVTCSIEMVATGKAVALGLPASSSTRSYTWCVPAVHCEAGNPLVRLQTTLKSLLLPGTSTGSTRDRVPSQDRQLASGYCSTTPPEPATGIEVVGYVQIRDVQSHDDAGMVRDCLYLHRSMMEHGRGGIVGKGMLNGERIIRSRVTHANRDGHGAVG